ncbi:hypothetical protein BJ138DRAFT_1114582 [Hygrophoropsis aurantiaca]|uniref:Uncharacterized protein n=1 Tax=Hygrophoropsis aurantiaca TaxID=72124 RepID=A0ACB8AA12_9AGAM|nr:hypothetical protein BJ138DRAFT_1114582 [Hygrophoropsis aurantiaca]
MANQTGEQDIHTTVKIIESEVLELEGQENDLLTHLCVLRNLIAHKRAQAGKLKNSLVPIHRLPNETLLACFSQVVQLCVGENGGIKEEHAIVEHIDSGSKEDFYWACAPAVVISHVSHHWMQLTINMPSLWANLTITPNFIRHMDTFQTLLRRVNSFPVALSLRCPLSQNAKFSEPAMVEAIMPLVQAQQIIALTFFDWTLLLSCLLPRLAEQPKMAHLSFSRLTALIIVDITGSDSTPDSKAFDINHLKSPLFHAPNIKSLELDLSNFSLEDPESTPDQRILHLPILEKLVLKECYSQMLPLFKSLRAPDLRQLELLYGHFDDDQYCFFTNNLPKFPKVQHLTLDAGYHCYSYAKYRRLISAFPRVTHLTLRSFGIFEWGQKPFTNSSHVFWHDLRYLTLDHASEEDMNDLHPHLSWLQSPEDREKRPLEICPGQDPKLALK